MEENMKRILVVDDEQDLCEILKFNLETEGYEVETANSAEEALEMDIASFDLLLLDVMMGGMSGFQLAKHLKDNPMTANVPIIFLTARECVPSCAVRLNRLAMLMNRRSSTIRDCS